MDNNQNKQQGQLQIDLPQDVVQGIYSNFAIISHSSSEFVVDFAALLPGLPKAQVRSRVLLAPEHAKRLLAALEIFYVRRADIRYHRNIGERYFGKVRYLAQRRHSHFDYGGTVTIVQSEKRFGQSDFVVVVGFCLANGVFCAEHGAYCFLGRRFADASRHGDHFHVEFFAV